MIFLCQHVTRLSRGPLKPLRTGGGVVGSVSQGDVSLMCEWSLTRHGCSPTGNDVTKLTCLECVPSSQESGFRSERKVVVLSSRVVHGPAARAAHGNVPLSCLSVTSRILMVWLVGTTSRNFVINTRALLRLSLSGHSCLSLSRAVCTWPGCLVTRPRWQSKSDALDERSQPAGFAPHSLQTSLHR